MIFTFLLISKKKYNYALFNCAIVFMQLIELIKYKVKSAAALCVLMDTPTLNARISENSIERDP